MMVLLEELLSNGGYYKILYQEWFESTDDKNGWLGSGWGGEEPGLELILHLDMDKYGHPTKGLFKYTGPVLLGMQHAAYNIQANYLCKYVEKCKEHAGKTFNEILEIDPEFRAISDGIDLLEKEYKIKEYLNLNRK